MADNITLNSGSGGAVLASDERSSDSAHFQYVKIAYGADNTQTIVGSISSNPFPVALSATDNAVLDSIQTAVELCDNAVFVDDAASTLGSSSGVMMMGFAGTQSVDANDAAALACETDGSLHIHDGGNSITVDNGGTFAVQAAQSGAWNITNVSGTISLPTGAATEATLGSVQTAVELIDNAIYVDDADWTDSTSSHMLVGGLYQSARQTITDGDVAPIQLTSDGRIIVQITDASGNDMEYAKEGDNWNAADHGIILFGRDVDSTPDKYRSVNVNASGHVKVEDGGNSLTVDNGGTFAVQVDGSALTALQLIDDAVYVDDADWTDSTSKHLLVGGLYQSVQQTITDGDVGPFQVDSNGNIIESNSTAILADTANLDTNVAAVLADTAAMDTNIATLAGAVAGTEMQVDIVSGNVTNAGTFAVQVDGSALTALQLIDNIVSVADSAAGATPTGVGMLAVRDDALTTLTPIEGDFVPFRVNSTGAMWAKPTNTGNLDSAVGATDEGTPMLAKRSDAISATADTDGDYAILQVDAAGALYSKLVASTEAIGKLAANSGVDIGDVDVTSVVPGTSATSLGKAEDAAHTGGDTGVMGLAVRNDDLAALAGTDGDYAPLQVDANGALFVNPCTSEYKNASGVAATGTVAMVAAVASRKIRIHAIALMATSATATNVYVANDDNALFGNSGNPIPMAVDADGDNVAGFVLPFNPGGWADTDTVNEAVNVILSAAQDIIYAITYTEIL